MTSGNGVPAASDSDEGTRVRDDRQLRDIQDLIAKLEQLNRQLSRPIRKLRTVRTEGTTTQPAASFPNGRDPRTGADTPASRRLAGARGRNRRPAARVLPETEPWGSVR